MISKRFINNVFVFFKPLNSTKFTAAAIPDRVCELQKESEICPGKDGFWEEFEVNLFILITQHFNVPYVSPWVAKTAC